jgi:hypothetical protein
MAGLFDDPELAPLSAVLFSNSGTVAQLNRIGQQFGYGVDDVRLFRYGVCYDPTTVSFRVRKTSGKLVTSCGIAPWRQLGRSG